MNNITVKELKEECKRRGYSGYSKLLKKELFTLLYGDSSEKELFFQELLEKKVFVKETCNICFEDLKCKTTPCNHYYCISCYDKWFCKNASCPVCRQHVNTIIEPSFAFRGWNCFLNT